MKKISQQDFINKAISVHGYKYDYSKSIYINSRTKINILCHKHGIFSLKANDHLNGQGCKKCKMNLRTNDEFIYEAQLLHKNKFDYSKTVFTKTSDNIIVTCKEHGDFTVRASAHLRGDNCGKCKGLHWTNDMFIEKARNIHGDKYNYSKTEFIGFKKKIIITCAEHGDFLQTPMQHLKSMIGCPICAREQVDMNNRKTNEEFIQEAIIKHNNKYSYEHTNYTTGDQYVIITCKEHGNFEQRPSNHLQGTGCPSCVSSGFNVSLPAILYYLSINNGQAYKVGITNRSIRERFCNADLEKITIISETYYQCGKKAYDKEQKILKDNKMHKYIGPDLLKSGNSELFTKDILCLS